MAAPQWSGTAPTPPPRPYGGAPDGLLLGGAILGLVLSGLALVLAPLQLLFVDAFRDAMPHDGSGEPFPFPAFERMMTFMLFVFAIFALVAVAGAIVVLRARRRLRRSNGADGRSAAITGAVLMLVGFNWIAGVLALIGALMLEPPRHPPPAY